MAVVQTGRTLITDRNADHFNEVQYPLGIHRWENMLFELPVKPDPNIF
jgi:hypothetical protein